MSRQATLLGVLAAVLIAALWWLFLYSPGQDDLAAVEMDIEAAEDEQVSLQQRITRLETIRARAAETEAGIATLRSFVPDDPALPSALRQIQAAAEDAGVELTVVSTARPEVADEVVGLHVAAIALSAEGSYFQLVDFLRRLEDPEITSRGITFNSLTLASTDYPTLTAAINGQMYAVLPPVPEASTPEESDADADGDADADADGDADADADGDGDDADTGDDTDGGDA